MKNINIDNLNMCEKFHVIDKCCNENKIISIPLKEIISYDKLIEIIPSKEGHSIVVHPDWTIEYIKI